MSDRISATLAVIEAANAFRQAEDAYEDSAGDGEAEAISRSQAFFDLRDALDALASASSPDLDAKIAEKLPCNCRSLHPERDGHAELCNARNRPAVRDLIVALLAEKSRYTMAAGHSLQREERARQEGFEQAREQAAKIAADRSRISLHAADEFLAVGHPDTDIQARTERCAGIEAAHIASCIRSLTPDTERKG